MFRFATLIALVAAPAGAGMAASANEENKLAFNTHCRNCHSIKKGDNRLGPSLHGIVGAPAGQVEGFGAYSGSLKGFTWDEATLDQFIANPTSVAPNTSMRYPPVGEADVRKKIIEYMKTSDE
jgi:cytochrome c